MLKRLQESVVTATSQPVSNRYSTTLEAVTKVNVLGVKFEAMSNASRTWSRVISDCKRV